MASPGSDAPPRLADPDERGVRRIVDRVRQHLGMDVAYLTEFNGTSQTHRVVDGEAAAFGLVPDCELPLGQGLCGAMIDGGIPNLVTDVGADARARLLTGDEGGVGAFIGVPVRLPDGALYGSLCCMARLPKPDLGQRDVAFVELLAEFLAEPLDAALARRAARHELEQMLTDGAVVAAMQPIVSLVDGQCVGVEALARFPVSGGSPDEMFGRAQQVGLDKDLERIAVEVALAQRELVPFGAHLSFNVGPAGILSDGFGDLLRNYGSLNGLLLEITEHTSVAEYTELANILRPLRAEGLRLAVDDVGAGYASLRHVLHMAPDVIKIDRSLVDGIATDVAKRSIVTGIVLLALDLGADTIAEGVETAADAAALTDLGIDMVQGYLFARPTTDPSQWRTWETPWILPGKRPDISRARADSARLTS